MEIRMFQIDAFSGRPFCGNPAAVCMLDDWLPDRIMLDIAKENNLAETAFCIDRESYFDLRWFTPELEIDLCGHATLATSHLIFSENLNRGSNQIEFQTVSGKLTVEKRDKLYYLNFPIRKPTIIEPQSTIEAGIGMKPMAWLKSRDYVLLYPSEEDIVRIEPDQTLLSKMESSISGIIVTAPGKEVDFVSRFFTPGASVFEDPVTGSAHCSLIPFWSEKLGKTRLLAKQLSNRGGKIHCELLKNRVLIAGEASTFMKGIIIV